jgi:hypothetical protein
VRGTVELDGRGTRLAALAVIAAMLAGSGALVAKVRAHERAQGRELHLALTARASAEAELDRLAAALASSVGVPTDVVRGRSLRSIGELEGFARRTTAAQRAMLATATVQLGIQRPGGFWDRSCTGTVVRRGQMRFVMTAAHCFLTGDVDLPDDIAHDEVDVRDVAHWLPGPAAVLASSPLDRGPVEPLVLFARVVASVNSTSDWAFGAVRDPSLLDAFGAIDLDEAVRLAPAPVPGEQVELRSYPQDALGEPVSATGRYLGRVEGVPSVRSTRPWIS